MIYVAFGALALALCITAGAASLIRSLVRQQARERQLLINQILHLSGRPWDVAPAVEERHPVDVDLDRYATAASDLLEDF